MPDPHGRFVLDQECQFLAIGTESAGDHAAARRAEHSSSSKESPRRSHNRIVRSLDAVASIRSSGLSTTDVTSSVWPSRSVTSSPPGTRATRTRPLRVPITARVSSPLRATLEIEPPGPGQVCTGRGAYRHPECAGMLSSSEPATTHRRPAATATMPDHPFQNLLWALLHREATASSGTRQETSARPTPAQSVRPSGEDQRPGRLRGGCRLRGIPPVPGAPARVPGLTGS